MLVRMLQAIRFVALLSLLLSAPDITTPAVAQDYPWASGEKLALELFWPSGVTLGEASLSATREQEEFHFAAQAEIVMPQGRIQYDFESTTTMELCSKEFRQIIQRGSRHKDEIIRFDASTAMATVSRDGQDRKVSSSKCARDPLAYLYYFRKQVAAGKLPSGDSLFLHRPLGLRIEALVTEKVKIRRVERDGDRYLITYPRSTGEGFIEIWLEKSPRHAPIAVRLPLPLATFSGELR